MKKTNWKKPTTIAVIAFIILIGFMFSQESDASETAFEFTTSASFVAGKKYDSTTLFMNETFDKKYQIGLLLMTDLSCIDSCQRGESGANQSVYIQRVTRYGGLELGVGISYWHNQTPAWNSNTPFALTIGYNFTDSLALNWRHFSTGGSSKHNGGLDMITVKYTF